VRNSPRQTGDHGRARLEAEVGATDARSRQPQSPPEDGEPDTSERVTVIEFLWQGRTGAQQVILVSREWLQ
jgi:hypothetical protein